MSFAAQHSALPEQLLNSSPTAAATSAPTHIVLLAATVHDQWLTNHFPFYLLLPLGAAVLQVAAA